MFLTFLKLYCGMVGKFKLYCTVGGWWKCRTGEVRRDYEKHAPAWRSSEQMLSPLYGLRPKDGKHCRLHTDFSLVPPNFLLHFITPGSSAAWRVEGTTNALRCLSTGSLALFFDQGCKYGKCASLFAYQRGWLTFWFDKKYPIFALYKDGIYSYSSIVSNFISYCLPVSSPIWFI